MHTAGHGMRHNMSAEMRACLEACNACRDQCLVTLAHCIEKGGPHAEARHLETLLDCVEICETAGSFLARGSERHNRICGACAPVCRDTKRHVAPWRMARRSGGARRRVCGVRRRASAWPPWRCDAARRHMLAR